MYKLAALFILSSFSGTAQVSVRSGEYRELNMAYDEVSKIVTGYYENYTGYDETTKQSQFSCIFYLEGRLTSGKVKVRTYYPEDKKDDVIIGDLTVTSDQEFSIRLPEEHGGCWNVEHFADEAVAFKLENAKNWIQIRYADKDRVYFYTEPSEKTKQKVYIIKGNVVYVEKIAGTWAFCSFHGTKTSTGWIRMADLNKLN